LSQLAGSGNQRLIGVPTQFPGAPGGADSTLTARKTTPKVNPSAKDCKNALPRLAAINRHCAIAVLRMSWYAAASLRRGISRKLNKVDLKMPTQRQSRCETIDELGIHKQVGWIFEPKRIILPVLDSDTLET
jgi:hypothetical protein